MINSPPDDEMTSRFAELQDMLNTLSGHVSTLTALLENRPPHTDVARECAREARAAVDKMRTMSEQLPLPPPAGARQ